MLVQRILAGTLAVHGQSIGGSCKAAIERTDGRTDKMYVCVEE